MTRPPICLSDADYRKMICEQAEADGAARERASIVAWLREAAVGGGLKISPQDFDDLRSDWIDAQDSPNICDGDPWDASLRAAADAIERGEIGS